MKVEFISPFLLVVGFYFSYSILAYLQILFLGNVFFKSFFLKIIFVILISLVFLLKSRIKLSKDLLSVFILLYLSYNFISFLALRRFEYNFNYWVFSFFSQQFWFFGVSLLYLFLGKQRSLKIFLYIRRFLFALFFLNLPIGLMQFITNEVILPVESNDNYFKTMSFQFYGSVRSFGFMASPLDFGLLNAMIYFICLSDILFVKSSLYKKYLKVFVLVLSIGGIYISMTRNVYLLVFLGTLFLIALKVKSKLFLFMMPLVNFLIVLMVVILGSSIFLSGNVTILKSHSLLTRLYEWSFFMDLISKANFIDKLIGMGIIQNNKLYIIHLPIDNIFLSIVLYNGLIGLLFFLLIFLFVYYKLLHVILFLTRNENKITVNHSVVIASGSFLYGFLAFSSFNNYYPLIYIFFLLPLLSLKFSWR